MDAFVAVARFVVGLLATKLSPIVAVLVGGTFVLYVAWTIAMAQV
jgi:hypothetical protein